MSQQGIRIHKIIEPLVVLNNLNGVIINPFESANDASEDVGVFNIIKQNGIPVGIEGRTVRLPKTNEQLTENLITSNTPMEEGKSTHKIIVTRNDINRAVEERRAYIKKTNKIFRRLTTETSEETRKYNKKLEIRITNKEYTNKKIALEVVVNNSASNITQQLPPVLMDYSATSGNVARAYRNVEQVGGGIFDIRYSVINTLRVGA